MSSPQEILNDPRKFLPAWMEKQGVTINAQGQLVDKAQRSYVEITNEAWLDYQQQRTAWNITQMQLQPNQRNIVKGFPEGDLTKAAIVLAGQEKAKARQATKELLKCEKEDLSHSVTFVRSLIGHEDKCSEAIIQHWMWMVKNKMLGRKVNDHIMPIFYSLEGGTGKSESVELLVGPLKEYRLDMKLSNLSDERNFQTMSENYIVVADEMQHADRADIDGVKNCITSKMFSSRILGKNEHVRLFNSIALIGTTNKPVDEIIIDTGMRRFWQINVQPASEAIFKIRNEIDYVAMWKGIDENRVGGYIGPYKMEISEKQEALITKDLVQIFAEQSGLTVIDPNETKDVTSSEMYTAYKSWCEDQGAKPLNNVWLGKKLSNLGFKPKSTTRGGKPFNVYTINKNAQVFSVVENIDNITQMNRK